INLTAEEAQAVLAVTEDGARDLFESSVACVGAATCQQGVRDSQSTLKMLVEAMRREGFSDGILPRIHISGCPSSCGTHQIGTLGFRGGVKLVDKKPMPAYMRMQAVDAQGRNSSARAEDDVGTGYPGFSCGAGACGARVRRNFCAVVSGA
ncbi:MAG: nitrite/sulfite reductase, partial [Ruthenibacterium lactatiformans]